MDDDEINTVHIIDGNRGNRAKTVVNDPGLCNLILRSRKPEGKRFKRWITHIVIPEIRRTGGFLHTTADITDEEISENFIDRTSPRLRPLPERNRFRNTLQGSPGMPSLESIRSALFVPATRPDRIDVKIVGPYKKNNPLNIPVIKALRVPGAPAKSNNLYDLSQNLAWVARQRRDIQEQLEWREKIPDLLDPLLR